MQYHVSFKFMKTTPKLICGGKLWVSYGEYFHGLAQDYSNSIANALELLQSSAKPSIWSKLILLQ